MDYRPLNAVTIADSYPLPRIQDNLEWLQGARVFSTLDTAGAYHVIPVEKNKAIVGLYNSIWIMAVQEITVWST